MTLISEYFGRRRIIISLSVNCHFSKDISLSILRQAETYTSWPETQNRSHLILHSLRQALAEKYVIGITLHTE
jgi:hypothetical protein